MALKIDQDHARFRDIVRGRIRENLKKYISHGELLGRQGKDTVVHPGAADRHAALSLRRQAVGRRGPGRGRAGRPDGRARRARATARARPARTRVSTPRGGGHPRRPRADPRRRTPAAAHRAQGQGRIVAEKDKLRGHPRVGPESLRHFAAPSARRSSGRSPRASTTPRSPSSSPPATTCASAGRPACEPVANAVIVYMMDVSGSMGDEQKEIVRIESFWLDTWLRSQYKGLESVYIIHDAVAREVDRDTFFHTRESGGTMISVGVQALQRHHRKRYPAADWNVYPFHFSDGDNWSRGRHAAVHQILKTRCCRCRTCSATARSRAPTARGSS
jgi:hypothetical protein